MSTEIPIISRVSTLWSEGKAICGFIDTVRFHTALRCRKGNGTRIVRQLERAYTFSILEKRNGVCLLNQKKYRQSVGFIVLMNVGNATGGKRATYGNNQESNLRNTQRLEKQENNF